MRSPDSREAGASVNALPRERFHAIGGADHAVPVAQFAVAGHEPAQTVPPLVFPAFRGKAEAALLQKQNRRLGRAIGLKAR